MGIGHPGNLQASGCVHDVSFGERKGHLALMAMGQESAPHERMHNERMGLEAGLQ